MFVLQLCGLMFAMTTTVEEPKTTIEEAYRGWFKGLASPSKLTQESTVKTMLPEQRDIDLLFPRYVGKLWPIMEQNRKAMVQKTDSVAQNIAGRGAIVSIKVIKIRENEDKKKEFEAILAILPKDIPLIDLAVTVEKGGGASGTYLYVNGRWIWIHSLQSLPELLKRL
jgi:hypothetical protein